MEAALYVVRYLSTTKTMGIYFTSKRKPILESFLYFPVPQALLSMSDADWGPQDTTQWQCKVELPLFSSQSMSTFCIDLFGPLHWVSQHQTGTAGSSAEAKIYATNACVKSLLDLEQLFDFLQIKDSFMPMINIACNDNKACVDWSKSSTTKGLQHIQMKENRVRENIAKRFVTITHVNGKVNLADLFTKEMKDMSHFVELRDIMMCHHFVPRGSICFFNHSSL